MMAERSELYELIEAAIKAADAVKMEGVVLSSPAVTRCVDVLNCLKGLSLSAESIYDSRIICRLNSLTNHGNPKICLEAGKLFDLWLRTLYASGKDDANKAGPLRPLQKKPNPLESGNLRSSILKGRDRWRERNNGERVEIQKVNNKTKLLELFEAAEKAADAKEASSLMSSKVASRCIEALNHIRGMPWSHARDAIYTTDIGNRLQSLTKHVNPSIRSSAKNLLRIWYKILYSGGRTSDTQQKTESKTTVRTMGCMTSQKRNGEGLKSLLKKRNSKPNGRSRIKVADMLGPGSPRSDESSRGRVREILSRALAKVAGEASDSDKRRVLECDPVRVAAAVESVMFAQLGSFRGPGYLKYKSIFFNVGDTTNPDLRRKVLLGEVTPERLVTMTTEEMGSEKMQREIQKIRQRATKREEARLKQAEQWSMIMESVPMECD